MINKRISKNKTTGKQKSKVSTRTKHNGRLNVNKGTKTKKQKLNTLLNYNGNKTKKNVKSTGFKTKKVAGCPSSVFFKSQHTKYQQKTSKTKTQNPRAS